MEISFDTFPVFQSQKSLQIIPYNGPPKPKQSSRRYPSKTVPFSEDEYHDMDEILGIGPRSNTQRKNRGDLAPTLHGAEVMDLTCLDDEVNCEIGGVGGGGIGDIGSDDGFSSQNERESVGFEQSILMRASLEDTRDESSNQSAPSKGTSQENAVVIEDSQAKSDTDEGCPLEDDIGTQIGDQLEVSTISTLEYRRGECSTGTEDAINLEAFDGAGTQAGGLLPRELTSTPPTSSSMMNIEQPTPEASGYTILKATTHQPQRRMQKKAERQGKFRTLESASSSSGTDGDDDDDSSNHTTWLICKRKRSPPAKRHTRTSNTTLKQRPKHAAHSARKRKLSPSRGRPLSNHPSAPKPLSAAQYSGYDTKICYSDDSSEESGGRGGHLRNNKRSVSTARPYRSRGHKRKRNRGTADEDREYEVEKILDTRVHRGKLQYHVKWLGYKDDPVWYDASNFKNSPHKLRDFHTANPTRPGPPKRLDWWVQCWEEDRDADGHLDDNKPMRSHTRGETESIASWRTGNRDR